MNGPILWAMEPAPDRAEIGRAVRVLLRLAPDVHAALAARVGVGLNDLLALDHLSAEPAVGVVELGRRLGMRSASATVLVDRLVAAGHVRRAPHTTDRRRTVLELTDTAQADVWQALAPLVGDLDRLTAKLDDAAAASVLDFLDGLCDVLADFAANAPDASTRPAAARRQAGR